MPDTVRSISTSRGVVEVAAHEQKLELAERLLKLDEREKWMTCEPCLEVVTGLGPV